MDLGKIGYEDVNQTELTQKRDIWGVNLLSFREVIGYLSEFTTEVWQTFHNCFLMYRVLRRCNV